jgi:hypothetical protein
MERHTIGHKSKRIGMAQHINCHRRRAAELAAERPFRALAVSQYAAKYFSAGGGAGDFLNFLNRIDGEQVDAKLMGAGNVALLLDRVAKRDAVSRRARVHRHFDFGDGGRVEA